MTSEETLNPDQQSPSSLKEQLIGAIASGNMEVIYERLKTLQQPVAEAARAYIEELRASLSEDIPRDLGATAGKLTVEVTGSKQVDENGLEDTEPDPEELNELNFDRQIEEEDEALLLARRDAELTASADSIRAYIKQIRKVKLLNAEQEVELAKQIEVGLYASKKLEQYDDESEQKISPQLRRDLKQIEREGERAKKHLLEANLRFVVWVANRYTGRGVALLDLIQEGNIGLMKAVERFDYAKGYKFSTYAWWRIWNEITKALTDQARMIRIPVHMVEAINKLGRVQSELLGDLGREVTAQELAKEMGITPEKVLEIKYYRHSSRVKMFSLDKPIGDEWSTPLGNLVEDMDALDPSDIVTVTLVEEQGLEAAIRSLPPREAKILRLRQFGLNGSKPFTQQQVAELEGITRQRIGQIESKTIAKLNHPSRRWLLRGQNRG